MKKTLIIAEIGVNHNGEVKKAKKLIDAAKSAGADIVKFQIFNTAELTTRKTSVANYQKKLKFKYQNDMLKKLQLSDNNFIKLSKYCKKKGIEFCASIFNESKLNLLKKLKLKRVKIPSGEITNYFLLFYLGKLNKKIILSTGMSTKKEISRAINLLIKSGTRKKNISILHCNTEYPSPIKDINLLAIKDLKKHFKVKVGYSDHSNSQEVPISATTLGAQIIEKHITLNKNLKGPDHRSSLNPIQFAKMVNSIRNTEILLGKQKKIVSPSEKKNIVKCRQYLVARKEIKKGETLNFKNITCKRIGYKGISPMEIKTIINKKAKKNYKKDEKI